jgi:hypothetical protein
MSAANPSVKVTPPPTPPPTPFEESIDQASGALNTPPRVTMMQKTPATPKKEILTPTPSATSKNDPYTRAR